MDKKYLISICMMVKDEEKNLPRCLDALKPLLEKPDIELIIVDTGSSDKSADIAKEYTDKVYFHQWNRHFSDMRNITISYAQGEFIFILDADEVLLDPVELYTSISEIKKGTPNTLALKIKNLNVSGGYTTISQVRIFRNDGKFHYEGAVHNQPMYRPPKSDINVTLEHYGYLFNDNELREKKFNRTAGILRDELKKDPNNIYYTFQLAKSNSANRDKKGALIEIRKAHKLIAGNKEKMRLHVYIYGAYASFCCDENEFNEAISVCNEGLGIEPEYVDLYYLMAASYEALGNKKAALECYISYIGIVEVFNELAISKSQSTEMSYNSSIEKNFAYLFVANEAFSNQEYEKAYEYVKRIDDDEAKMSLYIRILLKQKKYDELWDTYSNYSNENEISKIIVETIEDLRERMDSEAENELSKLFSDGDSIYSLLNRKRTGKVSNEQLLADSEVKEADLNKLPLFYADLFTNIDEITWQAVSIFKKLKKSMIRKYVSRLISKKIALKEFFEEFLESGSFREDFYSVKLYIGIAYMLLFNEAAILKNLNAESSERYYLLFKRYVEAGSKYVGYLYDGERLRLFYSTLEDQEDIFFIATRYAAEAISRGEYKAGIRYFKEAAVANPYMAVYMKRYQDELFPEPDKKKQETKTNE